MVSENFQTTGCTIQSVSGSAWSSTTISANAAKADWPVSWGVGRVTHG